jgi:hypothetical protein
MKANRNDTKKNETIIDSLKTIDDLIENYYTKLDDRVERLETKEEIRKDLNAWILICIILTLFGFVIGFILGLKIVEMAGAI